LQLQALDGGSVNDVWRVVTVAGRFVLRVDGAAWRRPGVDRQRELVLHRAAADAGLAPPLIAQSAALDVWVMACVDAPRWQAADFAAGSRVGALGKVLARLHRLPVPSDAAGQHLARFDPVQVAEKYAAQARSLVPRPVAAVGRLLQLVQDAADQLARHATETAIVHGDLTAGNLLGHERLWLIDWEYAQVADPAFDVAAVLVYQPEARAHQRLLLEASGQQQAQRDGRLQHAARIHDALQWLWRLARGENVPADAGISSAEWAN
jgi:thiamine kinase